MKKGAWWPWQNRQPSASGFSSGSRDRGFCRRWLPWARFGKDGADGTICFGCGFNSVSRLDLAHLATLPGPEGLLASSYYDVAVQPKGVFWLATSDGLVRYAPPLWRTPAALRPRALPVYAMVESENGTVWIMDAQGLRRCLKEEWQTYPFPEEEEFFFQPTDSMEELPNGNLAFTASGSGYVFDPITRVFRVPRISSSRRFVGWGHCRTVTWGCRCWTLEVRTTPCAFMPLTGNNCACTWNWGPTRWSGEN